MKVNVENHQVASLMTRMLSFVIDFGLAFFLSTFGSSLAFRLIQNGGGELTQITEAMTEHVSSSHLAKYSNGSYLSYTSDEYFEKTEDGYAIIDALSYYYLVYLTGDETKASTGDIVSPNSEKEMEIDGLITTPKAYYTVSWFNEIVLGLPKEGQVAKYDYFAYQKNELDEIDYSKIGTVNDKYITEEVADEETVKKVTTSNEMTDYTYEEYKKAVNSLYAQDYMVYYQNVSDRIGGDTTLVARLTCVFVFYILLPLVLKRGKTLGKLLMRASLVKTNGEEIARWQVLPRAILIVAVPFILRYIPNLFIQIGVVAALFIPSIILFFVNKTSRMVLHDYISQTIVVEDPARTIRG